MSIYKIRTEFGKHIKWGLWIIAGIFIVGAFFSFGPGQLTGGAKNKDQSGVIARVQGEDIKRAEFSALEQQNAEMMSQMNSGASLSSLDYADLRTNLIQQLVQNKLLVKAAGEEGVDLSNNRIDQEYDKQVVKVMQGFRARAMGLSRKAAEKRNEDSRIGDPRNDGEYKKQLGSVNRSINDEEQTAKQMVSRDSVLSQVAQSELTNLFKSRIKRVTATDIKNSYDVYTIRQIIISKDKLPKEQGLTQANKIADEAKTGDFSELAKKYSMSPTTGNPQEMPFEAMQGYPANVKAAIDKLKPGQVSRAIDAVTAYVIVKLEKKENKMPANLDRKARDERRKAIENARINEEGLKFSKKHDMSKVKDIEILDPELDAYWTLAKANQAYGNQKEFAKLQKKAVSLLEKAVSENPNNTAAMARLAQIYQQTGNNKKAKDKLVQILDKVDDTSLRMMLGDVYAAQGAKTDALAQYKIAGEMAQNDTRIHNELVMKYKQLGDAKMAAYEENAIKKLDANLKEWQKLQQEQGAAGGGRK